MLKMIDVSSDGKNLDLAIRIRCYDCGEWFHLECATIRRIKNNTESVIVCQTCETN